MHFCEIFGVNDGGNDLLRGEEVVEVVIRFLQDKPRFVIAAGELELVFEAGEIFVLTRVLYHINFVKTFIIYRII